MPLQAGGRPVDYLAGFRLGDQGGTVTELFGKVRDQAALAGLLNSLYELHMTLLSVEYLSDE